MTPTVLYHGSPIPGIKQLELRRKSRPDSMPDAPPAVYAGADPAYCAGHACAGTTRDGIGRGYFGEWVDGQMKWGPFTLTVPRNQAAVLEAPVSVYTVPAELFTPLPDVPPDGQNFWSLQPVPVLGEQRFNSVREAVESLGGRVMIKP
jgi:hypothetical protein